VGVTCGEPPCPLPPPPRPAVTPPVPAMFALPPNPDTPLAVPPFPAKYGAPALPLDPPLVKPPLPMPPLPMPPLPTPPVPPPPVPPLPTGQSRVTLIDQLCFSCSNFVGSLRTKLVLSCTSKSTLCVPCLSAPGVTLN